MSQPTTESQRNTARPMAAGAAVLGWLLLAALTIGRMRDQLTTTLHRDEAIAWTYANLPFDEIPGALEFDVNPPVYFLALHTWLTSGGSGEVFLRTLSVVAMLAAAAVSFDAARRLAAARAGWLTAAFVLLAPANVALAGLARPYAIAFLLGMIALDAAIAMVQGARWPALAAFSVAAALLPLTHYWGGLLLGALLVALTTTALLRDRRDLLVRTVIATGIALVALVPWAPTLASQLGNHPLAAHQVPDAMTLGTTLTSSAGGRIAAWVVGVGLGLALIAAWLRRRSGSARRPIEAAHLLLITATLASVAVVVIMWTMSQARPLFTPNYAYVVLAPLPVLVGVYLSRRWWSMLAVLAALAYVAVPDFSRSAFSAPVEQSDIRGPEAQIASSIAEATSAGDVVLTSPGRVLAVRYYLGDERDYVTAIGRVFDGRFDYRDRVQRLVEVDPAIVVDRLVTSPVGSRIAVAHDMGTPVDHPYWIALDEAMDEILRDLRSSPEVKQVESWRLDEPYEWIGVSVFEVVER
jgi:mannosyltransferase